MSGKTEVAVAVKDIHKEFILPQSKNTSFKQTFVNIVKKNNKVTQKVLDGVSFNVNKGDFFGIVGRNGSGKSTLLKLLAGVYVPTSGEVQLNGKLTPFIELGVGFNPELSGRDNVYLNGALLGFNRKQMSAMYDDIVEFAELQPFMDQKLKNYSSGMQVRLAFSIAIKAKNEILIFDEVLAVGDEAFQRKCLDVFEKYKADGQTVILVTHDMETVRQFCTRAVLINDGKVVKLGDPRKIADIYSELNQEEIDRQSEKQNIKNETAIDIQLSDTKTKKNQVSFFTGDEITIGAKWLGDEKISSIGINIYKTSGEHITGHNSRYGVEPTNDGITGCELSYELNLKPGKYYILAQAFDESDQIVNTLFDGPQFTVKQKGNNSTWSGLTDLSHTWRNVR